MKKLSLILLLVCLVFTGCGNLTEVLSPVAAPIENDASTQTEKLDKKVKRNKKKYDFRNPSFRTEHYKKHGIEMGYESEDAYLKAANDVISNPDALHKLEAEDDDHVYYIEATDEIVFLSQDGYIRTYFKCGGKDYFDRQ